MDDLSKVVRLPDMHRLYFIIINIEEYGVGSEDLRRESRWVIF